jgi:hypothetical protein
MQFVRSHDAEAGALVHRLRLPARLEAAVSARHLSPQPLVTGVAMTILNLEARHVDELRRRYLNRKYERADNGKVFVPKMGLFIGSSLRHRLNGQDTAMDYNLFTIEGRTDVLGVYFDQQAQSASLYLAPYSGSVTPLETWTASGAGSTPVFASTATELTTQYTSATRVLFDRGDAAAGEIGNADDLAVFTIATADTNIRGFGLLTASAKGATTGKLISVANLETPRLGLAVNDSLSLEFVIEADNAA